MEFSVSEFLTIIARIAAAYVFTIVAGMIIIAVLILVYGWVYELITGGTP